jgi:hypothetical protein
MSKTSTKPSGRSAKAARATAVKTAKKPAKSARGAPKAAAKTARGAVSNTSRASAPSRKPGRAGEIKSKILGSKILAPKILRTASPPTQPIVTQELPARSHKYQVGEAVYYTSPTFGRAAATGSYTVVKLLPSEGDDYQYRIKSSGEAFERVAKESQLDRA